MKTRSYSLLALAFTALAGAAQAQTPTPAPTPVDYVAPFKATPTPSPTLEERQKRTSLRISQRLVAGDNQLLMYYRTLYNDVWHNSDGLTPQQVCDALGTKATSLFVVAGTMANALYQIDPVGIGVLVKPPAGWTNVINADGTVILTYTPPTP